MTTTEGYPHQPEKPKWKEWLLRYELVAKMKIPFQHRGATRKKMEIPFHDIGVK
jgi:hypothetical protein